MTLYRNNYIVGSLLASRPTQWGIKFVTRTLCSDHFTHVKTFKGLKGLSQNFITLISKRCFLCPAPYDGEMLGPALEAATVLTINMSSRHTAPEAREKKAATTAKPKEKPRASGLSLVEYSDVLIAP